MDNIQPAPEQSQDKPKRHGGGLIGGSILLVLGVILLLQTYFPQVNLKLLGPIILIIIGAWLLYRSYRR